MDWLRSTGSFELARVGDGGGAVECAPGELVLLTAAAGSCEVTLGGDSVLVAGDRVLLLRGCAPDRLTCSPDFAMAQIVLRSGPARPGVMSPADLYAAYPDYRAFCALEKSYSVFHDRHAHVLSARRLISAYRRYEGGERELLIGCELAALLLCAASACVQPQESSPPGNRHVRTAIQFMRDNYMFDITMDDVARAAGVHVGHLHRLFVEQTGSQPGHYLSGLRMDKARFLLARTALSMAAISRLCGLSSQQYFSRCFKRAVGITPQEYRRTYAVTCDYSYARNQYADPADEVQP